MSQRLTFSTLKNSRVPALLNCCPDDPKLKQWVSSFEERASNEGRWWGSVQLAQFCITSACKIVLPREVAVVEAAKINGIPMNVRNMWGNYLRPHIAFGSTWNNSFVSGFTSPMGRGGCGCGCGCGQIYLDESSTVVSFATTTGNNQKIRTYPGGSSDVGKKIIYQGYDKNNIWVRTLIDGVMSDGEQVTLTLPFVDTSTIWGSGAPNSVIKDPTDRRVLVYSLDVTDALELPIAEYQPSETLPSYRTMSIPGYRPNGSCGGGCHQDTLQAVVSLNPQPIENDNDWLLFTNLPAYASGLMAEKYFESGDVNMFNAYFYGTAAPGVSRVNIQGGALPQLVAELRKLTGDKTAVDLRRDGVSLVNFR